ERWVERFVSANNRDNSFTHTFVCQFGDIKAIEVRGRNRVNLELKDGQVIRLDDGSNDVGARLKILDQDLGEVEFKWDRLDRVEFYPTPENLIRKFGDPIYGTVQTRYGEITGFIQWDHDERLLSDKLDGDTRHEDYSIPFDQIKSIEKYGRGVLLISKLEEKLELHNSNDVNRENRGIIVNMPGMGRVDVPWKEFEKIVFSDPTIEDVYAYDDFEEPESLSGTVSMVDGSSASGIIVYDLDETLDIEILNGEKDDIEYLIPFKTIKRIIPKNYYYSQISLRNGDLLLLGKSQDVTDFNTGILVFESENNYKYIPWTEIEEIEFK
ncbi:MAG: cell division protein FtsQ, partial [Bacteroidetes bacterium]|nr:cell division protein FtsQ [Bacteroidota bacterium]